MNRGASHGSGILILLVCAFALSSCRQTQKQAEQRAYTPQESLAAIKLSEDFKVELFLTEPQVNSPVEMVFDENGRIYVAEMLDYPDDPPPGKPVRSRIRLLEDNDGDGKYERAVVFADQVLQVSGLLPWKGGLLVTAAPDIFWMKDNDGDGRADVRKVLYTGFPKVNPEHRITNLRYGIDNWVYAANHGNDGKITSPDHPKREPLLIRGADFRFHPVREIAEASSGAAQYGLTFDEWGNEFITENTVHIRHVILPMKYIARAPLLDVPAYSKDISDHGSPSAPMFPLTGPQAWRVERTKLRQQRYDEQGLNRTEHAAGFFTGASGGAAYTGDVWPEEYVNNVFTGDVAGNLVHRDIIAPDGVTFAAKRPKDGVEFLASTDVWFRPCNFANAPDGNLYLMDVYRMFIETPESIPEEIKKGMDFYAGDTLGRIYRISSNSPRRRRDLKPGLGTASVEELVKNLENANGWHRATAQRLIVERQDRSAIPFLKQLFEQSRYPVGRIHAMWTLEGLSALDEQIVLRALKDNDPRVREHAVRLAEELLLSINSGYQSAVNNLTDAILGMSSDPDIRVQFQTAFTLGQLKDNRAMDALAYMAISRGEDQWFRLAILSSVADKSSQFFHLLRAKNPSFENKELFAQIATIIGARHDFGELSKFLAALAELKQPEAALIGLNKGLHLANVSNLQSPGAEASLLPFLNSEHESLQTAAWETARFFEMRQLVQKAMADAQNASLPIKQRVVAVGALRGGQYSKVAPILQKFLPVQDAPELQIAAIESLSSFDTPDIAATLLSSWKNYTPEVRQKTLNALLSERGRMKVLMKALEDGQVERTMADPAMQARLYDHPDKEVVERARHFFKQEAGEREAAVASYRDALNLTGDVNRGRDIYGSTCAKCHSPQKGRPRIGADLSGINNKTKEELLNSIMNPSAAIDARFVNYVLTMKDGRIFDGILANETPSAITLRNADGDVTILRKNIAELRASSLSLMPDGMEKTLTKQQVADLIAYLRGGL
ncbi:MAG TPA: PVC-type heme-binding CxxCH protein [Blastocatellia bacterium]|nr:PVC-type heme-binding CxxCH protein [Blastocatellia bacterium]